MTALALPPSYLLAHATDGPPTVQAQEYHISNRTSAEPGRGPFGTALEVAHTVFHARRGESLYLAEAGADRLILRALAGSGERTRLELKAPVGGGRLRAALELATAEGKSPRPRWMLDWSRRARATARSP